MQDCPQCDGFGFDGFEEDTGRPFACYFCGTSGRVTDGVFAEWEREATDRSEYRRLRPQYVIVSDGDGDVFERRLGVLPPSIVPRKRPALIVDYDDIPF